MKKIIFMFTLMPLVIFLFLNASLEAREYTDLLSSVRYEIPNEIFVHEQYIQISGMPTYMLAAQYSSPPMVVVYASSLRIDDDHQSVSEAVVNIHLQTKERPYRILTKCSWSIIAEKKYYVVEFYDNEKIKTYFVSYVYGWDRYIFDVCFVTKQPQNDLAETRERLVAQIHYPK